MVSIRKPMQGRQMEQAQVIETLEPKGVGMGAMSCLYIVRDHINPSAHGRHLTRQDSNSETWKPRMTSSFLRDSES